MGIVVYLLLAVTIGYGAWLTVSAWRRPTRFGRVNALSTLAAMAFILFVARGMSDTAPLQWGWLVALTAAASAAAATALGWPSQRDSTTSRSMSRT